LTKKKAMTSIEAAKRWRERFGYAGRGGVVVVFDGEGQGWVNELRNPDHWRPGCVAVDEAGRTWIAVAGNERNGAAMWMPNDASTWTARRSAKTS
jgi:hypothetical protein